MHIYIHTHASTYATRQVPIATCLCVSVYVHVCVRESERECARARERERERERVTCTLICCDFESHCLHTHRTKPFKVISGCRPHGFCKVSFDTVK